MPSAPKKVPNKRRHGSIGENTSVEHRPPSLPKLSSPRLLTLVQRVIGSGSARKRHNFPTSATFSA